MTDGKSKWTASETSPSVVTVFCFCYPPAVVIYTSLQLTTLLTMARKGKKKQLEEKKRKKKAKLNKKKK